MKEKEDKKQNVPKRRFPGFTEPWEQRKLSEVASSFEYGLNAAAKEYDGVNKYIRITDIDDLSRVFKDDDLTSPDTDLSAASNYKLHDGEILFARTGASVGKSFIYRESDGHVYFAGFLIRAKIKSEYDPEFVFQNTLGVSYEKYIQITSQRSGQPGVNAQEYGEYTFLVPDYTEQKKIGGFLRQLDNLITLHQRKLDDLKLLKKGLLQKMFPKNGEKIPEIRFPGFADDWEQRKLDQIAQKITLKNQDRSITETLTNSAEYGVISQGEFFDKEITNMDNISGYYVISPGDFVYNPRISNSAPCGPINRNELNRKGIMSPLYMVFSVKDVNPDYLKQFFKSTLWHRFMYLNGDTGARADRFAIKDKIFFEMPIPISKERTEQEKIGSFLNSFDTLITLHQRKLDDLKLLKKGLLQEMFV